MDITKFQPNTQEGLRMAYQVKRNITVGHMGCDVANFIKEARFCISDELTKLEASFLQVYQEHTNKKFFQTIEFNETKEKYDHLKKWDNFLEVTESIAVANCMENKEVPTLEAHSPRKYCLKISEDLKRSASVFSKMRDYYGQNHPDVRVVCSNTEMRLINISEEFKYVADKFLF